MAELAELRELGEKESSTVERWGFLGEMEKPWDLLADQRFFKKKKVVQIFTILQGRGWKE